MNEVFATSYFRNIVIPSVTVFLCVFLKIVSRNDRYKTYKREDFAIGLDLSISALIIFIADSINCAIQLKLVSELKSVPQLETIVNQLNNKLIDVPWIILVFVCSIWFTSTLVRKIGWKNDSELRLFCGIILPNIFGISSLVFVANWIG